VPRKGRTPADATLTRPIAVLLGAEGAGLSDDLLASADERLTVPMRPPVESLNVAITAAVILYEASQQRSRGLRRANPEPRPASREPQR
jgi:TrmH family RNA methyltransferase